jgi:hypothetical protein
MSETIEILERAQILAPILAKVGSLKSRLIAIEAYWGSNSWDVLLDAVTNDLQSHSLGVFSPLGVKPTDSDFKPFIGEIRAWPQAIAAMQLGNELAEQFGVEFYFPSPDYREADCAHWKDRSKGYPCHSCGILLLQAPDCLWLGICSHCHQAEEGKQGESKPYKTIFRNVQVCLRCGGFGISASDEDIKDRLTTRLCEHCIMWEKIGDRLTDEHRESIRNLAKSKGIIHAIKRARELLGISLREANFLVYELTK